MRVLLASVMLLCTAGLSACQGFALTDRHVPTATTPSFDAGASTSSVPASCADGVVNGQETDVDCGGTTCRPCDVNLRCVVLADCQTQICVASTCREVGCNDGMRNGNETDVDCGGLCDACTDGRTCASNRDCESGDCFRRFCVRPLQLSFSAPSFASGGSDGHDLVVADFDGDKLEDLATANYSSGGITIAYGQGGGSFKEPVSLGLGSPSQTIASADFDRDGRSDIVLENEAANQVTVLLAGGATQFGGLFRFDLGDKPSAVAVGDFDGDGKLDFVAAGGLVGSATVFLGDGTGDFPRRVTTRTTPIARIAVADLDGDGRSDLVIAGRNSELEVWVGSILGELNESYKVDLSKANVHPVLGAISIADLNDDGRPDITQFIAGDKAAVFLNDGKGVFHPGRSFSVVSKLPLHAAIADFDHDGKLDIAPGCEMLHLIEIHRGDGAGSTTVGPSVLLEDAVRGLAIGDFNSDGRADLAAVTVGSSQFAVILNTSK